MMNFIEKNGEKYLKTEDVIRMIAQGENIARQTPESDERKGYLNALKNLKAGLRQCL